MVTLAACGSKLGYCKPDEKKKTADTLVACKHNCSQSDSLTWLRSATQVSSTPDLETVENTVVQRGYMATPTLSAVPESANLNKQCTQCTQQQKKKKKLQVHV